MQYKRGISFAFAFIVAAIAFILALKLLNIENVIAVTISSFALAVSLVSAFRNELYKFDLRISANDIMLAPTQEKPNLDLSIVIPMSFINRGYGEGVVEAIAVKVIRSGTEDVKLYIPLFEIDMTEFIKGTMRIGKENIIRRYQGFQLGSKAATIKYVNLTQVKGKEDYQNTPWELGDYLFEIYAKVGDEEDLRKISEFDASVNQKMINEYLSGGSSYIFRFWTPEK